MADMRDFIEDDGEEQVVVQRGDNSNETPAEIKARLPQSFKGLVACKGCLLLRNMQSFSEDGCDNCGWGDNQHEGGNFMDFVTPNYEGFLSLLQPKLSWVAEWQQQKHCVAGVYAMEIYDDMPPRVLRFYTEQKIPYHRRQKIK